MFMKNNVKYALHVNVDKHNVWCIYIIIVRQTIHIEPEAVAYLDRAHSAPGDE